MRSSACTWLLAVSTQASAIRTWLSSSTSRYESTLCRVSRKDRNRPLSCFPLVHHCRHARKFGPTTFNSSSCRSKMHGSHDCLRCNEVQGCEWNSNGRLQVLTCFRAAGRVRFGSRPCGNSHTEPRVRVDPAPRLGRAPGLLRSVTICAIELGQDSRPDLDGKLRRA